MAFIAGGKRLGNRSRGYFARQIGAYILPEISGDALVERYADIDLQPPLRVHFWWPPAHRGPSTEPWQGCVPLMTWVRRQHVGVQALLGRVVTMVWNCGDLQ